jgi:hypothetical protein
MMTEDQAERLKELTEEVVNDKAEFLIQQKKLWSSEVALNNYIQDLTDRPAQPLPFDPLKGNGGPSDSSLPAPRRNIPAPPWNKPFPESTPR